MNGEWQERLQTSSRRHLRSKPPPTSSSYPKNIALHPALFNYGYEATLHLGLKLNAKSASMQTWFLLNLNLKVGLPFTLLILINRTTTGLNSGKV